jgi:glyoxylase-like metal-dependent hydrolase (beta-lactamase superfamily II)
MTQNKPFLAFLLFPLLAAIGYAAAPAPDPAEFVRIDKLSDRVLLAYWLGTGRCNLTAIKSEKGLVIIDTERSPRIMAPIKAKIEQAFGRSDWAFVINTHAHDNHAGGNVLFKGAVIVGHDNLPKDMQWLTRRQTEPEWKRKELGFAADTLRNLQAALPQYAGNRANARRIQGEIKFWQLYTQDMEEGHTIVPPTLTFADTRTLDLGDLRLELVFFGKSHSLSDILIYVPAERLLVTGGVVYQRAHLPEISEESTLDDVLRYIAVLDRFCADGVKIDRVIPSHSPPLTQKDLPPVRDYYQRMLAGVRAARKEGLTLEQTTERLAVRTSFPAFDPRILGAWATGMHERNIKNLWRIVGQEQKP